MDIESQTIEYMGDWYLLDSEQFGGEPVGCIADCVELVEGEKQLRDPGVDPAGRCVKCIKHFKYVKCIKCIKYVKYVKCIKRAVFIKFKLNTVKVQGCDTQVVTQLV